MNWYKLAQLARFDQVLVNPTAHELVNFGKLVRRTRSIEEDGYETLGMLLRGLVMNDGSSIFGDGYKHTHEDLEYRVEKSNAEQPLLLNVRVPLRSGRIMLTMELKIEVFGGDKEREDTINLVKNSPLKELL